MSRPRGGIIGVNATPAASALNSSASGVWTLREAEANRRAGTWPISFVNPTSISGLQLWLDAADPAVLFDATTGGSLVAPDGGVARWEDKSGNARHATQATSGSRPLRKASVQNGKDVIRFDGLNDFLTSADFLDLSSGQSLTAFVIAKRAATGSYHAMIAKADGTSGSNFLGWGFRFTSTNKMDFYAAMSGNETKAETSSTVTVTDYSCLVAKATSGSLSTTIALYRNGSLLSVARTGNTDTLSDSAYPVRIGAEFYQATAYSLFNGDIAEIIIYDTALSDALRTVVENYLLAKWGIS